MILHAVLLALVAWAAMSLLMALVWVWSRRRGNAGMVDVAWAAGLAAMAVGYAWLADGDASRRLLIAGMVSLWGGRLAWHLWTDRVVGKPEDPRYAELRERWRDERGVKFFFFFQFQALLNAVLSIPFLLCSFNREPLGAGEWVAAGLWLGAWVGESVADWQLKRFKADPGNKGRVCDQGLWRLSRHPNYFFEWLIWVSYAWFATMSPGGWISWVCPAAMLYFLLRVTGIPATEAQAIRTRGDAYRRYQETTSMFFPWPPRRAAS